MFRIFPDLIEMIFGKEKKTKRATKDFILRVTKFLKEADAIYTELEAETHQHQYCLIADKTSIAIRRLPYIDGREYGRSKKIKSKIG